MKKKTISKLKKELDRIFSIYVREKDAKNGYNVCYTCGVTKPTRELQCGHFISRSYLSTRFDEDNARPQCVGCNVFGGGQTVRFAENLERDCGTSIVRNLYKRARQIVKWGTSDYEEKIAYYKEKVKELGVVV